MMRLSFLTIRGDVVARVLNHRLPTALRAAAATHVWGVLLDLLFPCNGEQPLYALLCEHEVNRRHERRFVGDLTLPPTSGWRQGSQFVLRMGQTCFQPRSLLLGMHRGAQHQHPFRPCRFASLPTAGPL